MNRHLLVILFLAAAARPITSSAATFSGPPAKFVGITAFAASYVTFDLAAGGKFTGVINLPQKPRFVMRGTLDVTGSFSGTTDTGKAPFYVLVGGSTPSTYIVTGSADGLPFEGFPLAYSKGQTATETGTYTSFMTATGTASGVPKGAGYATLTVAKSGAVRMRGKLPDGTSFTAASYVLAEGTSTHILILYDGNIYHKKGYFYDVMPDILPATFVGDFAWMKMPDNSPYYPAGFTAQGDNNGFRYNRMPSPFTSGSGDFIIAGGGLATTGTGTFTVSSSGKITINPPNSSNIKVSIDDATGAAKGSFDYPHIVGSRTVNSKVRFGGLLLETATDSSVVVGGFLSPVTSGSGSGGSVEMGD
jgi:hypothetical protein